MSATPNVTQQAYLDEPARRAAAVCRRARWPGSTSCARRRVDRVGVLTVPTTRDEEWRFTDLSPLTKLSFQPVRMPAGLQAGGRRARFVSPEATTPARVRRRHLCAGACPSVDAGRRRGRRTFGRGGRARSGDRAASRPSRGIPRQRVRRAQHRVSARRRVGRRAARRVGCRAGASAVHRDASGARQAIRVAWWLPKRAARCTVIEDFVALQRRSLFHQRGDRDRARRQCARATTSGCSARAARRSISRPARVSLAHASRYRSVSVALGARHLALRPERAAGGRRRRCAIDGLALIGGAPARRHAHAASTTRSRMASAASCTNASPAAPRTRCSTARSWCARTPSAPTRRSRAATCC